MNKDNKGRRIFLYDLVASQPNSSGKYHGGGKYAKKVYLELLKKRDESWTIMALFNSRVELDDEIKAASVAANIELIDIYGQYLDKLITQYKVERFYSALPQNQLGALNTSCEFIGTVHGLRALETQMSWHSLSYTTSVLKKLKYILKIALKRCFWKKDKRKVDRYINSKMHVFTVSYHTKYTLAAYYPQLALEDIRVFYSPDVSELTEDFGAGLPKENLHYLMVSGNRWIKNNLRAAMALDELFTERPELRKKVIITGVNNKQVYFNKIKNKECFELLSYVDDLQLNKLYREAFVFLYPSLNEGFGYPPLEAMKHGIPVIASPLTSIPEICGEAALYANPFDVQEIKNRALQLNDTSFYGDYVKRGRIRYVFIKERQEKDLQRVLNYVLGSKL